MKKEYTKEEIKKRKILIIVLVLVVGIISVTSFLFMKYTDYASKVDDYNEAVGDYNVLSEGYISLIQKTSVENIEGMPIELHYKKELNKNITSFIRTIFSTFGAGIDKMKVDLNSEMEELVSEYLIAEQITNPSSSWVEECLQNVETITDTQQVTEGNDPNGFLGVDGGYTGCVYFAVSGINLDTIKENDIVSKGTDAGGVIEIYESKEDALIRCEYLSEFDNTLLYSGSYAIVGTMVIRTSYILSNEDQVKLTETITENLITLK